MSSAWAHPGSTPEMQWHSSSPGIEAAARARLGTQWNIEMCFQAWRCQISGATRLMLERTDKLNVHPKHTQAHLLDMCNTVLQYWNTGKYTGSC